MKKLTTKVHLSTLDIEQSQSGDVGILTAYFIYSPVNSVNASVGFIMDNITIRKNYTPAGTARNSYSVKGTLNLSNPLLKVKVNKILFIRTSQVPSIVNYPTERESVFYITYYNEVDEISVTESYSIEFDLVDIISTTDINIDFSNNYKETLSEEYKAAELPKPKSVTDNLVTNNYAFNTSDISSYSIPFDSLIYPDNYEIVFIKDILIKSNQGKFIPVLYLVLLIEDNGNYTQVYDLIDFYNNVSYLGIIYPNGFDATEIYGNLIINNGVISRYFNSNSEIYNNIQFSNLLIDDYGCYSEIRISKKSLIEGYNQSKIFPDIINYQGHFTDVSDSPLVSQCFPVIEYNNITIIPIKITISGDELNDSSNQYYYAIKFPDENQFRYLSYKSTQANNYRLFGILFDEEPYFKIGVTRNGNRKFYWKSIIKNSTKVDECKLGINHSNTFKMTLFGRKYLLNKNILYYVDKI